MGRCKRKSKNYVPQNQLKKRLDREISLKQDRSKATTQVNRQLFENENESSGRRKRTGYQSTSNKPRVAQQAQEEEDDRKLAEDLEKILNPGEKLRSEMALLPPGFLEAAFPQATFIDTGIMPEPTKLYSFEAEKGTKLIVLPFKSRRGHPSFVIRERLENGKFLFFLLDPASKTETEQSQNLFQETTEHLFNDEPGMSEWKRIILPSDDHRYDRMVLTFASLAMYLTLRQNNSTFFYDEDRVSFEFTARRDNTSIVKWARKWIHDSLANDTLCNDIPVATMMLACPATDRAEKKTIKT